MSSKPKLVRSPEAFDRFSRAVDGPLLVLSLLMIPLLAIPIVFDVSRPLENTLLAIDFLIWAVFAVEYVVKLTLAPDRWRFVRKNIPDLVIVVVPVLRPLRVMRSVRVLRLLRLGRIAAFAVESISETRKVLARRGVNYVLLVALAVVLVGSALILEFERGVDGSNIESYPDALWWALTTITTVGYGDRFPITAAGRGIAAVLMISGIAFFGVITASIAAYFVEHSDDDTDTAAKLDDIAARLVTIERILGSPSSEPSDRS